MQLPLLVAAALSAPLIARAALWAQLRGSLSLDDAIGVVSDIAISLGVAALLAWTARLRPRLVYLLLLPWALLQYGNYEHVKELGAGLQLTFAGYLADPTFLLGSALSPTQPWLLATLLGVPTALAALALRGSAQRVATWVPLLIGLGLGLGVATLPGGTDTLAWRRAHFVQEAIMTGWRADPPPGDAKRTPSPDMHADLDGAPIVPLPHPGTNVLLLILEGLSGLEVQSVADRNGFQGKTSMRSLSAAARRGLVASNFVLHQRQTNRGVYSLLCGDYPKLDTSISKMTLYLKDSSRSCLPRVLGDAAYETAYLQGAPLPFMFKDAFTELAGFDHIYGSKDFPDPIYRSYWGVDDRSLLRRSLEVARELETSGRPWLLTVLSVGTHHPAVIPAHYVEAHGSNEAAAAIAYLDEALEEFLDGFQQSGLLDSTLLIITSDESRGEQRRADLHTALSSSWGPLVVWMPKGESQVVEAPYGQSDVALSILDYVGVDPASTSFLGRSLFRQYAAPRTLYFANVFHRRSGAIDGDGSLLYCDDASGRCASYVADPARLFSPHLEPEAPAREDVVALRSAVEASRAQTADLGSTFHFDLIRDPLVPVLAVPEQQLLHGQNLDIPAGSRVEVEIELRVEGDVGRLDLDHRLRERSVGDRALYTLEGLGPEEGARIRYAFGTSEDMRNVKVALKAKTARSGALSIRFERARISVQPASTPLARGWSMLGAPDVRAMRGENDRSQLED